MSFTVTVKRNKRVSLDKVAAGLRGPTRVKVGLVAGEADSDEIMKGFWNEFGTRGGASGGGWGGPIPERPFLRNAMRDNAAKYRQGMKQGAVKALRGQTGLRTILAELGNDAQDDVKDSIVSLSSPPNSPVTIELKGSDNPLIDSGALHDAIRWKIDE